MVKPGKNSANAPRTSTLVDRTFADDKQKMYLKIQQHQEIEDEDLSEISSTKCGTTLAGYKIDDTKVIVMADTLSSCGPTEPKNMRDPKFRYIALFLENETTFFPYYYYALAGQVGDIDGTLHSTTAKSAMTAAAKTASTTGGFVDILNIESSRVKISRHTLNFDENEHAIKYQRHANQINPTIFSYADAQNPNYRIRNFFFNNPLVSAKKDIVSLYDEAIRTAFYPKALDLSKTYSHIRRIRGDGNCFYRAIITAVLERCFEDKAELDKITSICKGWRKKLFDFGFSEQTTIDFCDSVDQLLQSIGHTKQSKSLESLLNELNVGGIANYCVGFTRQICSVYLREHEALYDSVSKIRYIDDTLDQYCKDVVEPMWKECDHICIIALVNAFQVPIRIEYMDRTQAPDGGWHHDFAAGDVSEPQLFFLCRPSQYDILYRRPSTTLDLF